MNKIKEILNKLPFKLNPYIVTIAILILVIIFSLVGRRSQDATFDAFIDAYSELDAKAIVKLMPDEYIDALVDAGRIDGRSDMERIVQNSLDYKFENYYEEDAWSYSFEIVSEKTYKKSDDDLTFKGVQKDFGEYGDKIKEVVIISFDPTITYRDYNDDIDERALTRSYVTLVKIGQSWYLAEFHDIANWF